MPKPFSLPEAMSDYLERRNTAPDELQSALRAETSELASAGMRLNHDSAVMLGLIVQAQQPAFCIEIGTFTGYSSLTIARAMPADARLLCCDVNEEWTAIARRYWEAAGVADRIELRIGPAIDTLRSRPAEPAVDFALIDADKAGYIHYYEELVPRLSPRGLLAVDNTMWDGTVIDERDTRADTVAMRRFNDHVAADGRTTNVTVPIGDGITLIGRAPE